ncbi:hypothetical protein BR93DRAFT_965046 [Coniochaeta sp. PMI_546]|nr:hypothetical protein BR93DRAFT_965046 [Coniochaeta sp. PMI_546]
MTTPAESGTEESEYSAPSQHGVRRVFTLADIDGIETQVPYFTEFLRRSPTMVWIEFTPELNGKQAVWFVIDLEVPVIEGLQTFVSCRLLMGKQQGVLPYPDGEFRIVLLENNHQDPVTQATFAFRLGHGLPPLFTMASLIETLRGRSGTRHSEPFVNSVLSGDLTQFSFVKPSPDSLYHGVRDWVSQCFARLYLLGYVEWDTSGLRDDLAPGGLADPSTLNLLLSAVDFSPGRGFDSVIGKRYIALHRPNRDVSRQLIRRGRFNDPRAMRMQFLYVDGAVVHLPYINPTLDQRQNELDRMGPLLQPPLADPQEAQEPANESRAPTDDGPIPTLRRLLLRALAPDRNSPEPRSGRRSDGPVLTNGYHWDDERT